MKNKDTFFVSSELHSQDVIMTAKIVSNFLEKGCFMKNLFKSDSCYAMARDFVGVLGAVVVLIGICVTMAFAYVPPNDSYEECTNNKTQCDIDSTGLPFCEPSCAGEKCNNYDTNCTCTTSNGGSINYAKCLCVRAKKK